jgi:cyclic pyranopterin phosphate synthase
MFVRSQTAAQAEAAKRVESLEPERAAVVDQLQRPLRDLRVSVTDRCNFRCDYCMPAAVYSDEARFLPSSELLTFDEIERVVAIAVADLGVRKLRLTGGEPLLRAGLPALIARLARLRGLEEVTLTTNGFLLAEQAAALRDAGLSRVTISLDSLDPEQFARMSGGVRGLARVLAGIDTAARVGLGPIKLNCVIVRGQNEDSILALSERFRGTPHIVRFIEYMDVGTQNQWQAEQVLSAREIAARIEQRWPLAAVPANYPGEVAQRYRYADGQGEIGIIASVSDPFCGLCHRARLSADGRFLTCLFAADGVGLKHTLRSSADDAAVRDLLRNTWLARSDRYSEERAAFAGTRARRRLEMYQVGG